jgi:hypothetical protein
MKLKLFLLSTTPQVTLLDVTNHMNVPSVFSPGERISSRPMQSKGGCVGLGFVLDNGKRKGASFGEVQYFNEPPICEAAKVLQGL